MKKRRSIFRRFLYIYLKIFEIPHFAYVRSRSDRTYAKCDLLLNFGLVLITFVT